MSFATEIKKTIGNTYNKSVTENGAIGYKTTDSNLLDMNFKVSSYRNLGEGAIVDDFLKAFKENSILAMRWLFYARDAREGLGERRLFRTIIKYLAEKHTDYITKTVHLFGEYGRYDDLLTLIGTPAEDAVIGLIRDTLSSDMKNVESGKPITLLAKWLPSENASSPATKTLAKTIVRKLGIGSDKYRKMLSKLRGYLKVVERDMSSNNWAEINYEAVPSRANLVYNSAFLRHDEERRRLFLGAVEKGVAKINSSVNFPHDIVHKYGRGWSLAPKEDPAIEALWKALPNTVKGNSSTMVVADGSGSMNTTISGTTVTALEVANALAVYFAERCSGEFKNKYITFSSTPKFVELYGDSLLKNLQIARKHCEVSNTNIEAMFNLILQTAIRCNMKQEDLPANILIISDMEFDSATYTRYSNGYNKATDTLFQTIESRFKANGYEMPRLIFWNVMSRTGTIPVRNNKNGVALVSGFSTNVIKMVMGDSLDPYNLLLEVICSKRYDAVEKALTN